MKAVLISIQPQWCEKIAARRKTMELRKSKPNIPVPFKCYIYQTRHKWAFKILRAMKLDTLADTLESGFGKVVGEFVCDHIMRHCQMANADFAEQQSCVRRDKIFEHSGGKEVFGWHISNLVIYDDPKPLGMFYKECAGLYDMGMCWECEKAVGEECECATNGRVFLDRPPQSWCYVQEG